MSIAFDQATCKYCLTTAKDQQLMIYTIDPHFKQARPIFTKTITTLDELTLSSLCVVETSKKTTAYACIANGQSFEVYYGDIDHDIKAMELALRVD